MDNTTEKTLSNFVETQFPEFYLTDGPTFILFVKKYYEWLEGQQEVSVPFNKGTVSFTSANNVVEGKNTFFISQFEAGDKIGLFYDETNESYEIFTVDSVNSDTELLLDEDTLPTYSANNALYGLVKVEQNPNYHIRRLTDYSDVDATTDEFILYFKEKYLKNIQFTTKTNTRQLIKHSLDLYRSKGTIRGLQLLFRLVFGTSVNVYYPGTDVFRTSSGEWFKPQFLEVSLKSNTTELVNKQIIGLTSGATAFVESVVRRTVKGKFVDLVYVSSINGNFQTNELINTVIDPFDIDWCPYIIGSLTQVEVAESGTASGYAIGDVIDIFSTKGEQGKGRVTEISDISGVVDFALDNGGYGYTTDSEIAISERVLQINATAISANNLNPKYFEFGELLYQPMANISYSHANNHFEAGQNVHSYANGSLTGNGYVLSVNEANDTNGTLLLRIDNGTLSGDTLMTDANAIFANLDSTTDKTAVGNVVGYYPNCQMKVSNATQWPIGAVVHQFDDILLRDVANGVIIRNSLEFGANSFITLANCEGAFDISKEMLLKSNGASANIIDLTIDVGVKDITNDFFNLSGNYLYGNTLGTNATLAIISTGTGATFELSNSFNYTEDIEVNVDLLDDFKSVALNATAYGLSGNATANSGSVIIDSLGFESKTFGRLTAIKGQSIGSDYNLAPIAKIFESASFDFNQRDKYLILSGATGLFKIGELVTQQAANSRGLVTFSNSSTVRVDNLRVSPDNGFVETTNSTLVLIGSDTGFTANIVSVEDDGSSEFIGINADILSTTLTANGAITDIDIIGTGVGFMNGEVVTLAGENGQPVGEGHVKLGDGLGFAQGFWRQKGGFPSDTKYIFDGLYYQDYSYEIRSSITLDKYEEMLKKIMHIPGTKYFGAFVHDSINDTATTSLASTVTQS